MQSSGTSWFVLCGGGSAGLWCGVRPVASFSEGPAAVRFRPVGGREQGHNVEEFQREEKEVVVDPNLGRHQLAVAAPCWRTEEHTGREVKGMETEIGLGEAHTRMFGS